MQQFIFSYDFRSMKGRLFFEAMHYITYLERMESLLNESKRMLVVKGITVLEQENEAQSAKQRKARIRPPVHSFSLISSHSSNSERVMRILSKCVMHLFGSALMLPSLNA